VVVVVVRRVVVRRVVISKVSSLVVSKVSSLVVSKVSSLVVSKVVIRGSSPVAQISTPAILTRARLDQESSRIFARERPDKWPLANLRR
jgi:hypothetical protein